MLFFLISTKKKFSDKNLSIEICFFFDDGRYEIITTVPKHITAHNFLKKEIIFMLSAGTAYLGKQIFNKKHKSFKNIFFLFFLFFLPPKKL
ncbi:hypothetical protein GvMRE_IIg573 [endosymbiont GvMRE of Glomus versiforme]|nr:hypothetical protein GvMRE_IIg573 [endosymbiont GvMRE of Glomus versiforme]